MTLKNSSKIIICLGLLLITTPVFANSTPVGKATTDLSISLMEEVMVMVNCSDATLTAIISLISSNETLVHYPSEVNLLELSLLLCESITISTTPMGSALFYLFNTTDTGEATTYANSITPSISGAFGLSFTLYGAEVTYDVVNVTYTAPAVLNLVSYYTATLKPKCLKSDLAGFSDAIPNILGVLPSKSYVGLTAQKTSGDYDWQFMFFAGYLDRQIPPGMGYTVDVLNLIGATSLVPSSYSLTYVYYSSIVPVYIDSESSVTFASCTPSPPITFQYMTRGWYIFPQPPTDQLTAMFYFGNATTPVTALTLTFSGTITPEFSSLTLIIAIAACTLGVLAFKKRLTHNSLAKIR